MAELRAAAVYRDAKTAIVAVESFGIGRRSNGRGACLVATLEPVALVIRGSAGDRAVDLDGEPLHCEALFARVHGLEALLAGMRRH